MERSTVCGTGLDTVPLSGDISEAEIAAILLDVAALGVRHAKPLTARLMPMPGRSAGDPLHFDFPLFAESETEFFLKVVDAQVTFTKNDAGEVDGLVLHQNGRDAPGRKVN